MKLFPLALIALVVSMGCSKPEDATAPSASSGAQKTGTVTPAEKKPAVPTKYIAVQDVFTKSCMPCHAAGRPKAGINLSNYAGVIAGGKEGKIVTPGDPANSKIVMALRGKGAKQMPPPGPLPDATIKLIEDWINSGAKLE